MENNICYRCNNYYWMGKCKAFPEGIPDEIMMGKLIHNKPYKGDKGIIFDPLK